MEYVDFIEQLKTHVAQEDLLAISNDVNELRTKFNDYVLEEERKQQVAQLKEDASKEADESLDQSSEEVLSNDALLELKESFYEIYNDYKKKKKEIIDARNETESKNLTAKRALIAQLQKVVTTEENIGTAFASFKEIQENGFRELTPISSYNEDYHILQTTKEEHIMRPLRNFLWDAGIPVENSKGEAETGQEELNIKYDNALNTAEYHTIAKHAVKEISWSKGHAVTFLPKWHHDKVGSSSHVHQSLWKNGENAFYDPADKLGMSKVMKHYMAGLLSYTSDITFFLAPYVNSYKRFAKGTFAPTRIIWSVDNRTAGFRLCGAGSKSVRVECRIGGSDMNPYLAIAAQIAAGIAGIENKLVLDEPAKGDVYQGNTKMIPASLREAKDALSASGMLKSAFGEDVVKHYCRAAEVELEEFDRVVTDWEIARGFERA